MYSSAYFTADRGGTYVYNIEKYISHEDVCTAKSAGELLYHIDCWLAYTHRIRPPTHIIFTGQLQYLYIIYTFA